MALGQRIQYDTKAALLGGDRFVGDTLRNLKAAILNEEVATGKRDEGLSDAEIEKIIVREIKKRQESATIYEQNDRAEQAEQERKEAAVLSVYLPEQLSEAEIQAVVETKITELGATDVKLMGQVIGVVKADLGSSADAAIIARLVKEKLQ